MILEPNYDAKPSAYICVLQEWASEPKEQGWYWVSINYLYHGRHQTLIYIDNKQTYSAPTDWDSEHREHIRELGGSNNGVRWLGPLPVPEPPTESE
jgi:hypothetical protein